MGKGVTKKITPDVMRELRVKDANFSDLSMTKSALELAREYPLFAPRTIETFLVICRQATDTTFQKYVNGEISQRVVEAIVRGLDRAEQEFLLDEFLRRKMTLGQLDQAKVLRRVQKVSWAEALGKAMGEIPMLTRPVKDAPKTLDQLIKEIADTGRQFRLKVSMALDLLPETAMGAGKVKLSVFTKAYEIRHDVGEMFEFLDKRVKKILDEIETHARTEAELASRRDLNKSGGPYDGHQGGDSSVGSGGSQEGQGPAMGEGQQAVQGS